MTNPTHRLPGGKGYQRPSTGEVFPGVTTVIKALDGDPGSLIGWATKTTAAEAVRTVEEWQALTTAEEAERLIKAEARKAQNVKRDLGSAIHEAIEARLEALLEERKPPKVHPRLAPYLDGLESFLEETGAAPLGLEVTVLSTEWGYAGTLDAVLQIGSRTVLVDWKSGSVRLPMAAQLLLLQEADLVLHDDGSETPWLGADDLWLVQISPRDYAVHEVHATEHQRQDVLTGCLAVARVQRELGKMITHREAPNRALT